ncbi:MAG: SigB/SigF/SigG family RNA polymerase sigma factor [Clostridia bacterium]|nr:SigB/SigF/SigG family RNA polymerase sigma factor [Clostridia bacterium]MDD4375335.1 SigB/SigF/SigG family RNA polymerase sigma factor [Clostridia bacterium]
MKSTKVEINGVNTALLPVLAQKEQMKMLREIKEGKIELKDEFIRCNLRLVLSITRKFNFRGENVDDIFQVGVIGLIKAINNFDITQNVQFSTYAVPMIIGEIKRFLRDSSTLRISRSLRDISYKVSKERESYIGSKNEEPTVQYLAKAVGESEEDVIMAMDSMIQPISLHDAAYNDGGDVIYILDQLKNEKNEMENITDKICVLQAIEKLSEKERNVIQRRYFDNKTQMELAEEIGISQAQVSRIEKIAIARMKKRLENGM